LSPFTRRRADRLAREKGASREVTNQIIVKTSDSWSARFSYWAQVGTLGVLIFGYFYTVKPAFQKEVLEEETAKLTLANEMAQKKLDQTLADQRRAVSQLHEMQVSISTSAAAQKALQDRLSESKAEFHQKELQLQAELRKGSDSLQRSSQSLADAKKRELWTYVAAFAVAMESDDDADLIRNYADSYSTFYEKDFDGHFIDDQKANWPDPYKVLSRLLESARAKDPKQGMVPSELVDLFESRLEANADKLKCDVPNFDSMKASFTDEMKAVEPIVDQLLKDELAKQKRSLKFPYVYLTDNPDWDRQFKSVKRIDEGGKVVVKYRGELIEGRRACWKKTFNFVQIVNGA
jgi:hypothetical protein